MGHTNNMGYTLEQLQAMGARPVETPTGSSSSVPKKKYSLEELQGMGAKPIESAQPTSEPKQDGFLKSLIKDPIKTLLIKPADRFAEVIGRTGILGNKIKTGYEEMSEKGDARSYGGIEVEAQKGGVEGAKQIIGDSLKTASYLYGGGAAPQVIQSGVRGKVVSSAVQGAKTGAVTGGAYSAGESLQENNPFGKVLSDTVSGALAGGVTGLAIGGALPLPKLTKKTAQNAFSPSSIMQRVARISKTKQAKFEQTAGESVGEYLSKRGIYGDVEDVSKKLYDRFAASKGEADKALASLPGKYKAKPVETALSELFARETRVSSPGALSKDFKRVRELKNKYQSEGLDMSEINEVKRLYEKNIRLDFVKQNIPEGVAKSTNLDNALREWQFGQAERLGLKNLPEINRETRLAKQLLDDLGVEYSGSAGNNAVSLSDWVVLSGGDPTAVASFLVKKGFSSKKVQSGLAKLLGKKPTIGAPKAITGKPKMDLQDFLKSIEGRTKQPQLPQ